MRQIARPLAVAVATTLLVVIAAFVGNAGFGLLAPAGGMLAFLASSRRVLADPTLADPTLADPTLADPTLADPTLAGAALADPTLAGAARMTAGETRPVVAPRPATVTSAP